jgi:hypothetical protein
MRLGGNSGHVYKLALTWESFCACGCSGVLVFALRLSECFETNFWIGQFILYRLSCKVSISEPENCFSFVS